MKCHECNAWTRTMPVVWECEQVLWLRWQESDVCLCSQSQSNLHVHLHLPVQRAAFETRCVSLSTHRQARRGDAKQNQQKWLCRVNIFSCLAVVTLIIQWGKIHKITRTFWVISESSRNSLVWRSGYAGLQWSAGLRGEKQPAFLKC